MTNTDNLLFASINLPILDKVKAAQEILSIDSSKLHWDNYRHTRMIPLLTMGGQWKKQDSIYLAGELSWADYAPQVVVDWFENIVFPWMGCKSRVMALITEPGVALNEHIDCGPREISTVQHKLRIVVQGNTSTLYFVTNEGKVFVPEIPGPFLMDGGWVHGMINDTPNIKVTLALGAPWKGNKDYGDNVDILLHKTDYTMPTDLSAYWQK